MGRCGLCAPTSRVVLEQFPLVVLVVRHGRRRDQGWTCGASWCGMTGRCLMLFCSSTGSVRRWRLAATQMLVKQLFLRRAVHNPSAQCGYIIDLRVAAQGRHIVARGCLIG